MENEKRLIDANALLAELDKFANPMPNKSGYDFLCGVSSVITEIEDAPTVDAVEVVHGRWKYYHKQNIAVCTNCSFERDLSANFGKAISCPNCGAHMMDGGNEDGSAQA